MSTVVDLRKTDDPRDAIHRAVHSLAEGHIVAFPTETVYAACVHALMTACCTETFRLGARIEPSLTRPWFSRECKRRSTTFRTWIDLGQRLARRCWPGPVTLAFDVGPETGLFGALPPETRTALAPDNRLWIRVPAHECIQEAMRLMPAPLIAGNERGQDGRPVDHGQLCSGRPRR